MGSAPARNQFIVLGDLNARFGADTHSRPGVLIGQYAGPAGDRPPDRWTIQPANLATDAAAPASLGQANENGTRALAMCTGTGLFVSGADKPRPDLQRATWLSGDGRSWATGRSWSRLSNMWTG